MAGKACAQGGAGAMLSGMAPYAALAAICAIALAMVPSQAHADVFADIASFFDEINPVKAVAGIIASWLRGGANMMFQAQGDFVSDLSNGTIYTSFERLLGGGDNRVYVYAAQICQNIARSVGYTFMVMCFLVQLFKIGGRLSANDSMPLIKDIMVLLVVLFAMKFVVDNAAGICAVLFSIAQYGMSLMENLTNTGFRESVFAIPDDYDDVPQLMALLLVGLMGWAVIGAAWVLSNVLVWARGLQLYAMMAFSPIPLSLIGTEETRGFATGFMKVFLSVCLSLAVLMFIFQVFPLVWSIMAPSPAHGGAGASGILTPAMNIDWIAAARGLVVYVMLLYALIKSGSWARDILGG